MFPPILALPLVLLFQFGPGYSLPGNEFERIHGCQQFNSHSGYYTVHPYFDTSTFNHMVTDDKGVTRMRIGVLGDKHAAIRFTSVSTNSDNSMTEIALAHSENTRTDIRRFAKTIPVKMNPDNLGVFMMQNVMNIYKPLMLTVAIHRGGLITVTKDGDMAPFLQFNDPTFSYKYIGFCKWDVPVVFFYDCPLRVAGDGSVKAVPASDSAPVKKIGSIACLKVVECSECNTRDNCFSKIPRIGEICSETDNNEEIKCF